MLHMGFIGHLRHGSLAQACSGAQSKPVAELSLLSLLLLFRIAFGKAEELSRGTGYSLQSAALQ